MKIKNEKGSVLILSFMTFTLLFTIGQAFFTRTVNEAKLSELALSQTQAFYLAEGAKNAAIAEVRERATANIDQQVKGIIDISTLQSYLPSRSLEFMRDYSHAGGLDPRFALTAGTISPSAILDILRPDAGGGSYSARIELFPNGDATNSGGVYTFPYRYQISASGTSNLRGVQQFVQAQGAFTVTIQRDNFARYALFTNTHTSPSGSIVWFTNQTQFQGPVHTNDRFSFANNPSGTFTDSTSQGEQTARFYNSGNNLLLDANANAALDVPSFQAGFSRGVTTIPLPSTTDKVSQQRTALGLSAGETIPKMKKGIYLPADGSVLKGGIYVEGDASEVSLTVDASGHQKYCIVTQGSTTREITVNPSANTTTVVDSGKSATTYSGTPRGLLYVEGSIQGLSGTVSNETELTIATKDDLMIDNHVKYQNYATTPALNALGQKNILGLLSWERDVRIATTAPNDLNIHGTVMAPNGVFTVDNYNKGSPRGTVTLLGGVITKNYGAFGTFSGSNPVSGYGRNFVYDTRMREGQSPPYFPTISLFAAYNDGVQNAPTWDRVQGNVP